MASTTRPEYPAPNPYSRGSNDRIADWFTANARALAVGLGLVVLAGVGGVLWRSSTRAKAERAERLLVQAQAGAVRGDASGTERALRDVATRYAGTAAGAQAQLLLAQALYDRGQYQDGIQVLAGSTVPDEFSDAVRLLTAAGYEGVGRGAEAARIYEQHAAQTGIADRRRNELRASAARAHQLAGDRASARRVWREIVADATTPVADEARVRLGELSAR